MRLSMWPAISVTREKPLARFVLEDPSVSLTSAETKKLIGMPMPSGKVSASHHIALYSKPPKADRSILARKDYFVKGELITEGAPVALSEASTKTRKRTEAYATWLHRLMIGDGNRIPKCILLDGGIKIASKKIKGFCTLRQFRANDPATFVDRFIARLQLHDNLRIFAQILVYSLFFKENDLKEQHIGFDNTGRLTRIDFDNCLLNTEQYTDAIKYGYCFNLTAADLESLPKVSTYHAFHMAFNYFKNQRYTDDKLAETEALRVKLKQLNFNALIYEAILKLLITPSFFTSSLLKIVDFKDRYDKFNFTERQAELATLMKTCPGFQEFLHSNGCAALLRIKAELKDFCLHNSEFRKGLSSADVDSLLDQELATNMNSLSPNLFLSLIKEFAEQQIAHLQRKQSWFSVGVEEKIKLLNKVIAAITIAQTSPPKGSDCIRLAEQAIQHVARICHHRRTALPLFDSSTVSESWVRWQVFCNRLGVLSKRAIAISQAVVTGSSTKAWQEYCRHYGGESPIYLSASSLAPSSSSSSMEPDDPGACDDSTASTRSPIPTGLAGILSS